MTADAATKKHLSELDAGNISLSQRVDKLYGDVTAINATAVVGNETCSFSFDTTTIKVTPGIGLYGESLLAPNGLIYMLPYYSRCMMVIDPSLNKIISNSTFCATFSAAYYWLSGVILPNGRIIGIPLNINNILIFDTKTSVIRWSFLGTEYLSRTEKFKPQ